MKFNLKNKILEIKNKHMEVILFGIITAITLFIRFALIKNTSDDIESFIRPWFYELKNNGGLFGLKLDIGNYNLPYLTILALLTYLPIDPIISVKMVSILFDYICAFAVMQIIYILFEDNKNKNLYALLAYIVITLLPTVILNSSYWGQADSIYTAFILISIVYLLKEKYTLAFVYLGISFAFKLQFIFILPLYALLFISNKKISILHFAIIPIVNLVLCLPSIAFGKSFLSCIKVYINQTADYSNYLSMNFPGIWNILFPKNIIKYNYVISTGTNITIYGILTMLTIYAILAFLVKLKRIEFDKKMIIEFGLLSIMIATFFLPHMHDRYLYVADILSVLYYMVNKRRIYVPIGISIISLYTYIVYLFNINIINIQFVSYFYLIILILVFRDIYNKYIKSEN